MERKGFFEKAYIRFGSFVFLVNLYAYVDLFLCVCCQGFGFILPDDGSSDIFVHQTAIQAQGFRSLADGEEVEYQVDTDEVTGRRKAVSVTGPGGVDVQGAPFRPMDDYDDGY